MSAPLKPAATPKSRRWWRVKVRHAVIALLVVTVIGLYVRWIPLVAARQALDTYDNVAALGWFDWSAWLRIDPQEVALGRVRAYRRLRLFDEVRRQLLQAEALGVSRQKLEREQWLTLAQAGQMETVESKLSSLLNDSTVDVRDVCEAYVTGFLLTARSGRALDLINPWLADFPNDAQAYYLRGQAHISGRHYAEAETALRQAQQLAPQRTDIALALGETLLELQQPQVALPFLHVATGDPILVDRAWLGVAQATRRAGRFDQTRSVLKSMLERHPDHGDAWEELGRTQLDENEVTEACTSLEKAVRLNSKSLTARQAYGRALIAKGDPEKARPHLEAVAKANEASEKIRLLEDHAELHPKDTETRFQIAQLYFQNETPIQAIAWARSVLAIDPKHSAARKLLAELATSQNGKP